MQQPVAGTNPRPAAVRQSVPVTNPRPAVVRQPVPGTNPQVIETQPIPASSQRTQSVAKPVAVPRDPSDFPKPVVPARRFIDVQQPDGSYRLQELPVNVPHPAPGASVYDRPAVSPKPSELGLMPLVSLADDVPVSAATQTVVPAKPAAIKFNCDCGKPH